MQDVQELVLPGTAIILRATLSSDGMGGFDEQWAAVGTVDCRLMPQSVRTMAETPSGQAQLVSETRWFVTMPVGTVVTAKDRLRIGGRTFEVYQVNNSQNYQTAVRCEVYAYNEENRV